MAAHSGVILSGRIANLIYYQRNGKNCTCSMPRKFKQTKATKASVSVFGQASGIGAGLRAYLLPALQLEPNNKIQTSLTTAISQWLRSGRKGETESSKDLPYLQDFQFNEEGGTMDQRWRQSWPVSHPANDLLELYIPAFEPRKIITAPADTVSIMVCIAVASSDPENEMALGGDSHQFKMDYDYKKTEAQTISFHLPTQKKSILITAVSLKYMV